MPALLSRAARCRPLLLGGGFVAPGLAAASRPSALLLPSSCDDFRFGGGHDFGGDFFLDRADLDDDLFGVVDQFSTCGQGDVLGVQDLMEFEVFHVDADKVGDFDGFDFQFDLQRYRFMMPPPLVPLGMPRNSRGILTRTRWLGSMRIRSMCSMVVLR